MKGNTKRTPVEFLTELVKSPLGIPPQRNIKHDHLFSVDKDYRDLKCVRPTLTTFAAQLAEEQLLREVQKATKQSSGLHTFATGANDIKSGNFNVDAIEATLKVLKKHMPLVFRFLENMARPKTRNCTSKAANAPSSDLGWARAKPKDKQPQR